MFLQGAPEQVIRPLPSPMPFEGDCSPHSSTPRRRARPCILRMALLFCCIALFAGCASHGRRGLQPRSTDEATLQREVAQSHSPEPLFQLALLYLAEGRADAAVMSLREALDRDLEYEPALTLLARTLHQTGRSFEALEFFGRREVERWPDSVQINVALLHADVGNSIEARRILETKLDGAWATNARANLAYLDLLDEETVVARQRLESLIQENIESPEILNNLAVAHLRAGDAEGSAIILRRLVSRHADFGPAQLNLALLLQHWLFDDTGAARAQEHLDVMLEPMLSEAVIQRLLAPARVEDAAPPIPPLPADPDADDPEDGE